MNSPLPGDDEDYGRDLYGAADPYPRRREEFDFQFTAKEQVMPALLAVGAVALVVLLFFVPAIIEWIERALA